MRSSADSDRWLLPILETLGGTANGLAPLREAPSVWRAAVASGLVSDEQLARAVASRFSVPLADMRRARPDAIALVPERLARAYRVLPLTVKGSTLEVATADPRDFDAERALAFATGRHVKMTVAPPQEIERRIDEAYRTLAAVAHVGTGASESGREIATAGATSDEQPISRLVDQIVRDAVRARASDVHLQSGEAGVAVRLRVDGVLRDALSLPRAVGLPLVSRIKIMSGLDIADRMRPQDGRAHLTVDGARIDLRVSTLPVAHGEKVVIRLLDPRSQPPELEALGLPDKELARLRAMLDAREGLLLVTGPTGSGKTTTLYAALRHVQARGVNVVTVEDPVERRLPGVVQVQVNEKAGLTFAAALRSILRQDPDVVLIGEIRDRETAAIAVQASLTGHLVLSTLHTIDAASAVARLGDLGIEAFKIAASLRGVVAQRLVRRCCLACRSTDDAEREQGNSCATCGGSGFRGRLALLELLSVSGDVARTIALGESAAHISAAARAGGTIGLWDAGLEQVRRRETTIDELRRVIEQPDAPARRAPSTNARLVVAEALAPDDDLTQRVTPATLEAAGEIEPLLPRALSANELASNSLASHIGSLGVTEAKVGVVDVYVIRPNGESWRVLVLQRALDTRCPGAWETVHGRIEPGEYPEDAAVREVAEETGLQIERLYSITVQPFYLQAMKTVQLAVVFAAFVAEPADITLGEEHQRAEWRSVSEAMERFVWPREREALTHITQLLRAGNAGAVEDVLRVF